jgi:Fur family transcriptional regulator, ferric uptake regulator
MQLQKQVSRQSLLIYHSGMIRNTRQRAAISQAMTEAGRPLLPQEILEIAQQWVPGLNLATVYRNLNLMAEDGSVTSVQLPGQPTRFEVAGTHHHHFLCRRCDRVYDIHACSTEIARLAPKGFEVEDHEVVLYGSCPGCRGRSQQANGGRP